MNIGELLDRAKLNSGATSDSDLARRIHVTRSAVSSWRVGRAAPDIEACDALAKLADLPLQTVVGLAESERAISPKAKAIWKKFATAAALVLAVGSIGMYIM